jgi:hypothetical protein
MIAVFVQSVVGVDQIEEADSREDIAVEKKCKNQRRGRKKMTEIYERDKSERKNVARVGEQELFASGKHESFLSFTREGQALPTNLTTTGSIPLPKA